MQENKGKYVWLVRPRENWNIRKRINIYAPQFWIGREDQDIDELDVKDLDWRNAEPYNI